MRLLKDVLQAILFYTGSLYVMELVLARLQPRKGVRIFFCHHVSPEDCAAFERALRYLKRRYDILSLEDAVQRLAGSGELTRDAAVITFDDGYADNYENGLPTLRKLEAPVTFFITTGPLDGEQRLWFDQVREWVTQTPMQRLELGWIDISLSTVEDRRLAGDTVVEMLKTLSDEERLSRLQTLAAQLGASNGPPIDRNRTVSPEQLREMAKTPGVTLGGHTVSHPILPNTSTGKAWEEISGSAHTLERITGHAPSFFAYPNGDHTEEHKALLHRAGYVAGLTTCAGGNRRGDDPYALHREPLPLGPIYRFAWQVSGVREGCQSIGSALRMPRHGSGTPGADARATNAGGRAPWGCPH